MMESTLVKGEEERIFLVTCKPYFSMFCNEFTSENGEKYISYGISAKSGWGTPLDEIRDVSTDRNAVAELVKTLNRMNVSVTHLKDVVEDFLATY